MIAAGRVSVNGKTINTLGISINPLVDEVAVDGEPLSITVAKVAYAFNKPEGVVSSMNDEQGRSCLSDFLGDVSETVHHVGRLDIESSGLLILTNDGELTQQISHPSHEIKKTYVVTVSTSNVDLFVLDVMQGVMLDDGLATADACFVVVPSNRFTATGRLKRATLLWQIHDGRNRIIRRITEKLNSKVIELH